LASKPNEYPWISTEIKNTINACDRAYRKWKRYKTEYLDKQYCSFRIKVNKSCWLAIRKFYQQKFHNESSGKEFWKNIESIPREPYLPEIKMGPRITSTCLVSFGPLVCTALNASTFKNTIYLPPLLPKDCIGQKMSS